MANNFKNVQPNTDPMASDVRQTQMAWNGTADMGLLQIAAPQATPAAPTAAVQGSAGNLNGAYMWKVVLITGWQQDDGSYYVNGFAPSADSASLTVTNGQASLSSIPTGASGTIGRAIYRTPASGASGTEKYVWTIWDNTTTTYIDNTADANIGTGMPTTSTTPAVYNTAVPANVPTSNTTGTFLGLPNLTALPAVQPAPAMCIVNNVIYQSNGAAWVQVSGGGGGVTTSYSAWIG